MKLTYQNKDWHLRPSSDGKRHFLTGLCKIGITFETDDMPLDDMEAKVEMIHIVDTLVEHWRKRP